ncbi:hypothetical protein V1Y59_08995 [Gordonia sp. PKS22-38]|uniref:Uncharacterized protein n=1 Tax=Gordonia prachuapensis TaxID=3115651 RepID=A0ABU7MSF3_9ACTN|nr:hypothetical protein [Gordonia sp. PKS22-38]
MTGESNPDPPGLRRDLNGRPVTPGRWERLRERVIGRRHDRDPLDATEAELVVVAESDDDAAASSVVLDRSSWRPDDEVVLRHVLRLPASRLDDAVATAALDGYTSVVVDQRATDTNAEPTGDGESGLVVVHLARVQTLDAVHLSQERSRMASLGSRHRGVVLRWEVLQRPVAQG